MLLSRRHNPRLSNAISRATRHDHEHLDLVLEAWRDEAVRCRKARVIRAASSFAAYQTHIVRRVWYAWLGWSSTCARARAKARVHARRVERRVAIKLREVERLRAISNSSKSEMNTCTPHSSRLTAPSTKPWIAQLD